MKNANTKLFVESARSPEGIDILRVAGEASVGDIALLETAVTRLSAGMPDRFVLDLMGLRFASSLAIGQIMSLLNTARTKRKRAAVACAIGGDIHGVLLRSRADLMAPIHPSVDAAIAALVETQGAGA